MVRVRVKVKVNHTHTLIILILILHPLVSLVLSPIRTQRFSTSTQSLCRGREKSLGAAWMQVHWHSFPSALRILSMSPITFSLVTKITLDSYSVALPIQPFGAVCLQWRNTGIVMVGPFGDWLNFPYDVPLHLVAEPDCCRIITSTGMCHCSCSNSIILKLKFIVILTLIPTHTDTVAHRM